MSETMLSRAVVGHGQAAALLERALDSGSLRHAYLFLGPARVGKTTLARAFARALSCLGTPRPCGRCRPCQLAEREVPPGYYELRVGGPEAPPGDSDRERPEPRSISIRQIRWLQHDASLTPGAGRWKLYVLDAQALLVEAANCLLKTLEEPPAHVVHVLTAEEPEALLPTLVSRCQQVRLAPVPAPELEAALRERWGAEPERARLLARLAAGRVGWAVEALSKPALLDEHRAALDRLLELGSGSRRERFACAEELAQDFRRDPERVYRLLGLWLAWWRDVLLARVGCEELVGNADRLAELRRRARLLSVPEARAALRATLGALENLRQNVNPQLALEVLLLDLPAG